MAVEPRRRSKGNARSSSISTVWVGSVKVTVPDFDLLSLFSRYGDVESCKIMRDDAGNSRGFAYVSYLSEKSAERAAEMLNGFSLHGSCIKTKGPNVLKSEGHTPRPKIVLDAQNYRPYTDCCFFMQGNHCKKGKSCPYRHNAKARDSSKVCSSWKEKMCLKKNCPKKHPGGKEQASTMHVAHKHGVLVCGGMCGLLDCDISFQSLGDLARHLNGSEKKCQHCSAIFISNAGCQEHVRSCHRRSPNSISTDCSSTSLGVESLSDSDEEGDSDPVIGQGDQSPSDAGTRNKTERAQDKIYDSTWSDRLSYYQQHQLGGFGSEGQNSEAVDTLSLSDLVVDDDSEDDEEEIVNYSKGEMARLLSLNEHDMIEDDGCSAEDQNEGKGLNDAGASSESHDSKSTKVAKKKQGEMKSSGDGKRLSHRVAMEPVGVFWDIENCSVPVSKSAFAVAAKMRRVFITGKREAEFMCVCDITKERKEVTDDLHKAQVTLVHVNAIAKNAADDKLRHSLRRFAHTYPSPATVVLISGDVNFSMELNDLIHLHNLTVVLVHNSQASDALKAFATHLVNYDTFIQDVEPPTYQQNPNQLPRIVVVSGLPRNFPHKKISDRLDRLSDNCGGKVLRVDTNLGTAKILFRTNEWARKALKRMNGEDVHGHKVSTSLESELPPSSHPPQPHNGTNAATKASAFTNNNNRHSNNFQHLGGPSLAHSFPPPSLASANVSPYRMSLLPSPPMNQQPPPTHLPQPPHHNPYSPLLPNQHRAPPPRGAPYPIPLGNVEIRPGGGGRGVAPPGQHNAQPPLPPFHTPPHPPLAPFNRLPRFPDPPCANIKNLPKGTITRHEGRILVFNMSPAEEARMDHTVQSLQVDAFFSAQHKVLWHSHSELQLLFKLDFIQTALIRKEEIIHLLYEKGELPLDVAEKFVETCTRSISDVLRRLNSVWQVTMCGWTLEEEENRIIRSNAVSTLRCQPTCWIKFSDFKSLYQQRYFQAISEMSIHTACSGAVQILSSQSDCSKTKDQVVIIHEFSPLVKIVNSSELHARLRVDCSRLLAMQPGKRIKLLDFMVTYRNANLGPLPLSSSGKILQDVLSTVPHVEIVGSKPSVTYVVLNPPLPQVEPSEGATPQSISAIGVDFHRLLEHKGKNGLALRNIQQEYQTFFHRSFRVSDYFADKYAGLQDLLMVIPGVKVMAVNLPNGKEEKRVFLDSSVSSRPPETVPVPTRQNDVPKTEKIRPISEIASKFHQLLESSPGMQLTLRNFQQVYQMFFHSSFRVSMYMTGDVGLKELLEACPGIKLDSKNGEEYVGLDKVGTKPSTDYVKAPSPQMDPWPSSPTQSITVIAADFTHLLENKGKNGLALRNIQQEYQTFFHRSFRVSDYCSDANAGLQDLLKVIPGVKVMAVNLPNGKEEKRVFLDSSASSRPPETVPAPTRQNEVPKTEKTRPISEIAAKFHQLLECSPGTQLPLRNFQQFYQTFFHRSFRVSTYMTGNVGLKELLEACPGIKVPPKQHVKDAEHIEVDQHVQLWCGQAVVVFLSICGMLKAHFLEGPNIKFVNIDGEKIITLDKKSISSVSAQSPISKLQSKPSVPAAVELLEPTAANIGKFKHDCVEVLSVTDGCCILAQFPEHYLNVRQVKFQPANYKAKKLLQLLNAIPDVVEIFNDNKEMRLICSQYVKVQCEAQLEAMLYAQKDHCITLDRIMYTYETMYGRKLEFHGHPKLLKLLESFPDILEISGGGTCRQISLAPLRLFLCEMRELLSASPSPMMISKIVPAYKEHFGKQFTVAEYGYPKLLKLLEALPEMINIHGSGATRTISLKKAVPFSLPCKPRLHPDHLVDEVVSLLLTTHGHKLSLIELTKKYNTAFRPVAALVEDKELLHEIQQLSNFKVSGMGPTCYVQLEKTATENPASKSSEAKGEGARGKETKENGGAFSQKMTASSALPTDSHLNREGGVAGCGRRSSTGGREDSIVREVGGGGDKMDIYLDMPELVEDVAKSDCESTCSSSGSAAQDDEGKRLANEIRRMLLVHQEHAMTLTELFESFQLQQEPACLSIQTLYRHLEAIDASAKKFQISTFPGNLGASVVQLNRKDCLWKLGGDLLHLFVYRPTSDLSHHISTLETLYQECYSKKLVTAVYSAKSIQQVLKAKDLKSVIQVDQTTQMCSPCDPWKLQVLATLLTELIFLRGDECRSLNSILPMYQDHFGVTLPLHQFQVESVLELMKLPKIRECIELRAQKDKVKAVLKTKGLLTEQLRHLLTVSNGCMALDKLESLYVSEFGSLTGKMIANYVKKNKLPHFSFHVVNLSSLKWAVWAPQGHPIPPHRRGAMKTEKKMRSKGTSASTPTLCTLDDPLPGSINFDVIGQEASEIIGRIDSCLSLAPDTSPSSQVPFASVFSTPVNSSDSKSSASLEPKLSTFDSTYSGTDAVGIIADLPAKIEATYVERRQDKDFYDGSAALSSAYDFLKEDPGLLAELSKQPQGNMASVLDTSFIPANDLKPFMDVLALQGTHDMTGGDRVSVHGSALSSAGPEASGSSRNGSEFAPGSGQLPLLDDGVDFLQKGLDPDQVLDQMDKLKDVSGGILTFDQINSFLDYFGEISSRDLEALEAKSHLKKKSGCGEVRKKKRNMAIRFPSQSKTTSQECPTVSSFDIHVPANKLSLANFDGQSSSDESDHRESPAKALNHEKFIKGSNVSTRVAEFLGGGMGVDSLPRPLVNNPLGSEAGSDNLSCIDAAQRDVFLPEQKP